MRSSEPLAKLAICCASFLLFVLSLSINELFDGIALYMTGINMVFIPAGIIDISLIHDNR
jgi:hypothetical protein